MSLPIRRNGLCETGGGELTVMTGSYAPTFVHRTAPRGGAGT
jgi:hypothetical protein